MTTAAVEARPEALIPENRAAYFDSDDRASAIAELEARHGPLTSENLAARETRELTARWHAEGPDAVLDRYVHDCASSTGAGAGLGDRRAARAMRTQLQTIPDLIGDGRIVLREVVAQRGEHLVLLRQAVAVDGYEVEMLSLIEVAADGRQVGTT